LNNSNGTTLQAALALSGGLTLTSGGLADGGFTLTVNGNVSNATTHSGSGKILLSGGSGLHTLSGSGSYGNLQLNDVQNATLTGSTTVAGTLTLTTGTFTVGANTLTLQNAIAGTPTNLSAGSTSSIVISGSGSGVNLPSSVSALNNLTLNNSNGSTLQAALALSGGLTLTSGALADGGFTLTVNGNISNGATHSGSGKILLSGGSGSHTLSGSGTYGNLELNDANGATLTGSPTVTGTLTLTTGSLADGGNTLTVNGNVANATTHSGAGKILLSGGGGAHTLSGSGTYGNLDLNDAMNATITGSPTITGTLTLTSGTFTVGANTLTLQNAIGGTPTNLSAGGTSSIVISGSGSGVNVPSSVTALNNLTLNNSNGTTLQGSLALGGSLTMTSGTLADGGFTLTANENVSNSTSHTGSGKILLSGGAGAHTLSGAGSYGNLEMNDGFGATLTGNPTVTGTLTLTNGLISTGANTLTIGSAGSATAGSASSYVDGKLARVYAGTGSKAFPIGKGGNFRAASLDYTALTGTSTVTAEQTESALTGTLPAGTSLYMSRYWTISQTGGSGFTYNVTLDPTGFTPAGSPVILKRDGSIVSYPTTTPNYTVTGLTTMSDFALGDVSEPTAASTSMLFSGVTGDLTTVSWTSGAGTGANHLVVAKAGSAVTGTPSDGTGYTADAAFGSGNTIAAGEFVVFNGSGTSVPVTGLSSATTYYYAVFEYNGTGATADYLTSSSLTGSQMTASTPTLSSPTATSIGTTTATLGANVTSDGGVGITDRGVYWGTSPNPSSNANSTAGTTGVFTVPVSGLPDGTLIYYRGFATNPTGTGVSPDGTFYTLKVEPTTPAGSFAASSASTTSIGLTWTAATGADGYLILQRQGSDPTGLPSDATAYAVSNAIGDATVAAVITSGATTSTTISGLSTNLQYNFSIIPFAWDGANGPTYNYKTSPAPPTANASTISNLSDVVATGGFSYPANIAYSGFTGISDITAGNSLAAFGVTVRDGGSGSPDADALGTVLTAISFTTTNVAFLDRAALYDGATELAEVAVSGSPIVFSGFSSTAADNSTKDLTLRVTFKTAVTDNQQNSYTVSSVTTGAGSSLFAAANGGGAASSVTGDNNRIEVTATKLDFTTQPSTSATVGTVLAQQPVVTARDVNNNTDLDYSGSVTLTNSGALSTSGNVVSASSGVVTYTAFKFNAPGASVTLTTSNGSGLTNGTSTAIAPIYDAQPTVQASAVNFPSVADVSVTVSWTNGDGENRIVLMKAGSAVNSDPVDGTSYTANTVFGSGTQIGTGNYVVFSGTGNSVTVTGLSPSTTYHVAVYEFNASVENYLAPGATGNQTTTGTPFTWSGPVNGNWSTAGNWTPSRTSPATSDILVFNSAAVVNLDYTSPQTISKLQVTNNSNVVFTTAAVHTLNIGGGAGADLQIDAGSSLTDSANSAITISILTGATGSVSGSFITKGISAATGHQLLTADGNSVTFQSGSLCKVDTFCTGNLFGPSGTPNSIVVFAAGSVFEQHSGSNPFASSTPASKVTFQKGSLFRYKQKGGTPSFSGRTYANYEQDVNDNTSSPSGAGTLSIDTLKVTNGLFNIGMTGTFNLNGDIICNDSLTFNGTGSITLSGTSTQTISGSGVLTFAATEKILDSNVTSVKLGRAVTLNNNITLARGTFDPNGNILTGGAAADTIYVLSGATQRIDAATLAGNYATWNKDSLAAGSFIEYSGAGAQTLDNTIPYSGLKLSGGAKTVSGTLNIKGDLVNTSGFSGGTIALNGTGSQAVSGSGSFGNLTVNKSAGTASLGGNITEDGTLTITLGQLVTGANTVTLSSTGSLSEAGGGNVVIGNVQSTTTVTGNLPSADGALVNYTFGNIGLEINPSPGPSLGATTVTRVTGTAQGLGPSIKRYFDITPTNNTGLNATLVFHFDSSASELNGNTLTSSMGLWKSTDLGVTWTNQAGTANAAAKTVTKTGVTSFSRWTASDPSHPMVSSHARNSDIVIGAFPVPATISSLINTKPGEKRLFQFLVRDGGGTADTDVVPTIVKNLSLRKGVTNTVPDWSTYIQGVDLFQNSTHIDTTATITANNISWAGPPLFSVADNHVDSMNVYVYLKNPLPAGADGKVFEFLINQNTDVTTDALSGSIMAAGGSDVVGAPGTAIDVTATKLAFAANIPGVQSGQTFSTVLNADDANNNIDKDYVTNVGLAKATGTGTFTVTTPKTPVAGVATFNDAKIVGSGSHSLIATSGTLTSATSNIFGVGVPSTFKVSNAAPHVSTIDTLAWDSTSTWTVVRGVSATGIPHMRDSVILDHDFRATAYTIRLGPTISDSCRQITIGYPGNTVPIGLWIPPNNNPPGGSANAALWFGDSTTGNYDFVLAGGGTVYDNKTLFSANVKFATLSDSMKIRTGGYWYHNTSAFNTMHRILSRAVDGDYGTIEFDVNSANGTFDISGGGNYYYPNIVLSNTHTAPTYFWFGTGATTIHGNVTVNAGAKDSLMLTGYPFLFHGNYVNNGVTIATTSQFVFDGAGPHTVSGNPMSLGGGLLSLSPGGATFNSDVSITGGTVQTTGTFTYDSSGLPTNITRPVVGTITMGGSTTMNLNPAGAMSEGSNPVQGNVSATRTALQNVNQTFGAIGYSINAAGGAPGSTTVLRKTGAGSTSTGNGHQSIKRYYDVTPTNNSTLNATTVLGYSTTELNGIPETNLLLEKSTNSGATWTGKTGTVNTGSHFITATGVNSFSRWTAAAVDSPLFITHTITVRKYSDADGLFGTAGDETLKKWRLFLYKDSVVSADSIAGGNPNNGVLTVSNLEAGTYIAVEADSTSFGWTRLGKIHNGTRVATSTRFDTLVVSGGVSDSADFINHVGAFTGNSVTVRKFKDNDGNFSTAFDRSAKSWYLEVRDTGGTLIGSINDTVLTISNIADNQYVAREADSTGWIHLGYILNGTPAAGSGNSVMFTLSGGQNGTVDFVNASPSYSQMYRSFQEDSIALDKDNKGKVGKFVKRKTDKADFIALFVDDTATVTGLHVEFGNAILQNYPFFTTPPSTHLSPDGKNKKWDFTFTSPVHHGDSVYIHGFGDKGKIQKVGKYYWENGATIVGTKKKNPLFTRNDPKFPMPNRVNALFEAFAQTGFGANGLLVGRDRSADSAKQYGWILAAKYTDVLKSLKDKTGLHTGFARGFDTFTSNGKPILKRQKSIPPAKQNNRLIADMLALRLNIVSSMLLKTPLGFGELIFSDTSANPYNGLMVKEIAAKADTLMMGRYQGGVHVFVDTSVFRVLDQTIQRINSGFEGAIDTIDFTVKLHMKGTKQLAAVPYLHANGGVVPAMLVPLDKPIVETPQSYKLYQNYPNPFNPTTTIQFDLMDQSVVTLKIYNILGQEVATLLDHATLEDGTQEVEFNASNFASGVYFYRLISESVADPEDGIASQQFTTVKKMLLIK
jgi:hypothetical protein